MPCDTRPRRQETLSERVEDVRKRITRLNGLIVTGRVKAVVGPQGAIAFQGWTEEDRDGITDACAYRRLMVQGSMAAKMAIERAAQLAGRGVDRQALAQGHHSHDGGNTWHKGH